MDGPVSIAGAAPAVADRQVPKTPWELPGYLEAVSRETFIREAAYQDITETVAGFELRPLSLRNYLVLRATGNPLLIGGEVTAGQLLALLWLLSPEYDQNNAKAKAKFYKRSGLVPPAVPLVRWNWLMRIWRYRTTRVLNRVAEVLAAVRAYVDEALQDYPGSQLQGREVSYYGEGTSICSAIAREYHWAEREILELPMKRLLQYWKEMVGQEKGPSALSNPSDQVKADFLRRFNQRN